MKTITVVGGGLAGCEAAWQAAERGLHVSLYEMRPDISTGAHVSSDLAELVCSNSLGSNLPDRAAGLLKEELRLADSLLIKCADDTAIPAGGALAVDRSAFSELVTQKVSYHPNIQVVREEQKAIPSSPTVIASGPLTSPALSSSISRITGQHNQFFFDAIAPIVTSESINMSIAFRASRYIGENQDSGDYINCPFSKVEYYQFIEALLNAERIPLRPFESDLEEGVLAGDKRYFEGCLPIEILAGRGPKSLAFGPLRPVGLNDPKTGKRPYAVLQLRQENLAGSLYNLVGFQTNLKYTEQELVLRMIPGLENAEFIRYGEMHRNTFIASPLLLSSTLQFKKRDDLFFAGQITGIEGYAGNIATGLLAGINAARFQKDKPLLILPGTTMMGALCHYITHTEMKSFQPMKANFGILPFPEIKIKGKRKRAEFYAQRAIQAIQNFLPELSG
jgi:methylenetetrahydrofolate--tRNA-(uracil-5-)-methyltransferase